MGQGFPENEMMVLTDDTRARAARLKSQKQKIKSFLPCVCVPTCTQAIRSGCRPRRTF